MYEIDELAGIVAMASEYEQLALTEDIKNNGQREPAVLWQNRLVDGRCRQLACKALGIELLVRPLDPNLSREEVAQVVKSLNTRRNLTDTQKCMSAFKQQEAVWETNETISKKWGIPLGTYKNARYVGTNRPEVVEPLFNGKSVQIFDPDKGRFITTNKINTIARIIKMNKERGIVTVDNSEVVQWKAEAYIKTEAGKAWYYEMKKIIREVGELKVDMLLAEMANMKYSIRNTDTDK